LGEVGRQGANTCKMQVLPLSCPLAIRDNPSLLSFQVRYVAQNSVHTSIAGVLRHLE